MSGKQKQRPSLSSAHHHGYSSLHYQPIGPTRTMPLAPPAANDDKKLKKSSNYVRNYWPSWLSPRVARRPTGNQASLRNQRCESILSNGGGGGGDDDYTRGGAGLSITTTAATARLHHVHLACGIEVGEAGGWASGGRLRGHRLRGQRHWGHPPGAGGRAGAAEPRRPRPRAAG